MQNPPMQGQPMPDYYGMTPPPPPGVPGPRPQMPSRLNTARPRNGLWRMLGLVILVGVVGVNILMFLGAFSVLGGKSDPHGVAEFSRDSGSGSKIAVIPVDGVILEGGGAAACSAVVSTRWHW